MFLGIQVRANSQKVWSEAKNGERDWGQTPIFFSLASHARSRAQDSYATLNRFLEKNRLFCSLPSKRSLPNTAKDISDSYLYRGRLSLRWA